MSFRPKRQAALNASNKLGDKEDGEDSREQQESSTELPPDPVYRNPVKRKKTRKRKRRYALNIDSDEEEDDSDEDFVLHEEPEEEVDIDEEFEITRKRKRGQFKYNFAGPAVSVPARASPLSAIAVRKQTTVALVKQVGNVISMTHKIVPKIVKVAKVEYSKVNDPLFDMDCDVFESNETDVVDLEEQSTETSFHSEKRTKPSYLRAEGNVVYDLLMWCDLNLVVKGIFSCFKDILSGKQIQKYHMELMNYKASLKELNQPRAILQSIPQIVNPPLNINQQTSAMPSNRTVTAPITNVGGTHVIRLPVTGSNGQIMQLILRLPSANQVASSLSVNSSPTVMFNSIPNAVIPQRIILPPNFRLASAATVTQRPQLTSNDQNVLRPSSSRPTVTSVGIRQTSTPVVVRPNVSVQSTAVRQTAPTLHNVSSQSDDFTDVTCIIRGGSVNTNLFHPPIPVSLTVKPLPVNWPSNAQSLVQLLVKLDQTLVKEQFKEIPGLWMVKHHLVKKATCVCGKPMYRVAAKKENGGKLGLRWICVNPCKETKVLELPSHLLNGLGNSSISQFLFAIYYWAIGFDVTDVVKNKRNDVDVETMVTVWKLMRDVCNSRMETYYRENPLKQHLSLATAKLGNLYLVGVMAGPSVVRFSVFDESDVRLTGLSPVSLTMEIVRKWLPAAALISVSESKFLVLNKEGHNVRIIQRTEFVSRSCYIGYYFVHHLRALFQTVALSALNKDSIVQILNELQWREKFGSDPNVSFTQIITSLANFESYDNTTSIISSILSDIASKSSQMIYADEYYYSSLSLRDPIEVETPKNTFKVTCNFCKKSTANVFIPQHFVDHIKNEAWFKAKREKCGFSKCDHCLREFDSNQMTLHLQLAESKILRFACRICCLPLMEREKYLLHMTKSHSKNEMPYCCSICYYRTSFHKDLLNHFEKEHVGCTQVMCHFCLKIFDTKFSAPTTLNDFYRHLVKHYQVECDFSCTRCCLLFTEQVDLNIHQASAHNTSQYLNMNVIPHRLNEVEKGLSLLISSNELLEYPKKFPSLANRKTHNFQVLSHTNKSNADVELKFTIGNCYWANSLFENKPMLKYMDADENDLVTCIECKKPIYSDHFIQKAVCPRCTYSTYCKDSFHVHIASETAHRRTSFSALSVATTVYNCTCNFYTTDGNNMALHLATSHHSHCYVGNAEDLS